MILPAGRPVALDGTAEPSAGLMVEFGTQKKSATANKDGKWLITLDPMPASMESRVLRIHAPLANAEVLLHDVVVGDIWLCAGQSNMNFPVKASVEKEDNAAPDAPEGEYRLWLKSLVASWRDLWHSPDLPFIVIQLPDYDPGTDHGRAAWARVQNEQAAAAQDTDGVWVVETQGLGDPKDIHPRRKKEVGIRAATTVCRHLQVSGAPAK